MAGAVSVFGFGLVIIYNMSPLLWSYSEIFLLLASKIPAKSVATLSSSASLHSKWDQTIGEGTRAEVCPQPPVFSLGSLLFSFLVPLGLCYHVQGLLRLSDSALPFLPTRGAAFAETFLPSTALPELWGRDPRTSSLCWRGWCVQV